MKPSASSDCSKGGSTATMSLTTASPMGYDSLPFYNWRAIDTLWCGLGLVQSWCLEQPRTVGRGQHHIEGDALMIDGERHVDAGRPERPELPVEAGLACDLLAVDSQDHIAGLEVGARRWAFGGNSDHDDPVVDLG